VDLDSLRCFVAVAEALRFRAAARRVGLSPAALSDRVRLLEEELGVRLFDRTTRRVLPTDAGLRLLPHARALLDEAARCAAVARGRVEPAPYELTLGTRAELGLSWLCPALAPLGAAEPRRALHLAVGDTDELLSRVGDATLDAAVLSTRRLRPRLTALPLHEEDYVFVGRCGGPAAAAEAAAWHLLDVSPDLPLTRYLLDALPDGHAWLFGAHRYLGGIGPVRHQVLAGAGVAVLPRYFVEADLQAGAMVRLLPALRLPTDLFRLIWRDDHPRDAELRQLAVELRAFPLQ